MSYLISTNIILQNYSYRYGLRTMKALPFTKNKVITK
ncbi:MAG: hypothetical protein ACI8XB_001925 [Patiriisocius sp.]